jgi:hypothetical protein
LKRRFPGIEEDWSIKFFETELAEVFGLEAPRTRIGMAGTV